MFLPDPRKEVIARRVIDPGLAAIWFPGNEEALEYNRRLTNISRKEISGEFVMDQQVKKLLRKEAESPKTQATEFSGDEFTRRKAFSRPRTVTLDTKYEGAVAINVWTGYAVLVVSKTGNRKVVVGPHTCLLEYDEFLETIELSTDTPKTEEHLIKTAYLRVLHNKVSDIAEAETSDMCRVQIHASYRVNFEGESEKWFNVENYVKFMTDHIRSLLRHAIRQHGIEAFYTDAVRIVRDTVLGTPDENGKRTGAFFEENNMRIYDVEVLDVIIGDDTIEELLINAQHTTVKQTLEIASEKKRLEVTEQHEDIRQQIAKVEAATSQLMLSLQEQEVRNRMAPEMAKIESEAEARKTRLETKLADQQTLDQIYSAELSREKAKYDLELQVAQQQLVQRMEELKAEVQAVVTKAKAVSPQLVAALRDFSDKALAERMAESMAPMAILGGKSVAEVFGNLLKGTVLEKVLVLPESETGAEDS